MKSAIPRGALGLPIQGCLFLFFLLPACNSKPAAPVADHDPKAALIAHGQVVYRANCIACHNPDPHKQGSIGPDIFGSSRELIEARVTRAGYPLGYKPKRETKAMPPLPQLKSDVDALHAYLNSGS